MLTQEVMKKERKKLLEYWGLDADTHLMTLFVNHYTLIELGDIKIIKKRRDRAQKLKMRLRR